jgi:hypothetical protein
MSAIAVALSGAVMFALAAIVRRLSAIPCRAARATRPDLGNFPLFIPAGDDRPADQEPPE